VRELPHRARLRDLPRVDRARRPRRESARRKLRRRMRFGFPAQRAPLPRLPRARLSDTRELQV